MAELKTLLSYYDATLYGVAAANADNRSAINTLINTVSTAGGGTILLPAGTLTVSGTGTASAGAIQLKDNVTLAGQGMGLTTIKLKDSNGSGVTGLVRTPSGVINHNCTLRDVTIDGNKANNASGAGTVIGFFCGVTPGGTDQDVDIACIRVEIKNCNDYGFDPHEQTLRLLLDGCLSHDNGLDGYVADYQVDAIYRNCQAYNNARHGFNVTTSTPSIMIDGCYAYGNGTGGTGSGITVQRGSSNIPFPQDVMIRGCHIRTNADEGILCQMANDIVIASNIIHDNQKRGIRLYGASNCVVANNKLRNNSQQTNNTYDEIQIITYDDTAGASGLSYGALGNMIIGNMIRATATNKARYAIRGEDATCDNNRVIDNDPTGTVNGTPTSLAGTNDTVQSYDGTNYVMGRATSTRVSWLKAGQFKTSTGNETTTAPSAGGAGALPATPAGYATFLQDSAGTSRKIPYY